MIDVFLHAAVRTPFCRYGGALAGTASTTWRPWWSARWWNGPGWMAGWSTRSPATFPERSFVNLGIGQPTKVSNFLDPQAGIVLHTGNGMLGMGPRRTASRSTPNPATPARRCTCVLLGP